jgi:hypothetical protein
MITLTEQLFDELVSKMVITPCCQTGQSPRPCRNAPRWYATVLDGCGRDHDRLLCTFHKTRWLQISWEKIADWGYFRCTQCGLRFETPPHRLVTFRPL